MVLAGQETAGTHSKYLTGVWLPRYLWGIPGFDTAKSLAEKLSANACSLTYHVTGLEPRRPRGECRVAPEVLGQLVNQFNTPPQL